MLTIKKKKFINLVAKTGNILQSYIDAGYSSKYANVNAYKLVAEEEVKEGINKGVDAICNMTKSQWGQRLIGLMDHVDARVSDMTRILEIYGKSRNYIGADTTIQNVNYYSQALDKLKSRTVEAIVPKPVQGKEL